MKVLKRMFVHQIWGSRSLEVTFNPELTLLYGINGSGKTTVLDIIGAIASGHVEALLKYEFKEIRLEYQKNRKDRFVNIISEGRKLIIDINGQDFRFEPEIMVSGKREVITSQLFASYTSHAESISKALAAEFETIYLPLSRDSRHFETNPIRHNEQVGVRVYGGGQSLRPVASLDDSLEHVGELVKENHRRTMFTLNELNQTLRQDMFETSLAFYAKSPREALTEARRFDNRVVTNFKEAFSELQLLTSSFATTIDTFFDKLSELRQRADTKESDPEMVLQFLVNAAQIQLVQKWQELAEKANRKRAKVLEPMDTFLGTVNQFFQDSGKSLTFNSKSGYLTFSTEPQGKQHPLDKLSSGEKQLVIFFAYLIFRANAKKGGIFLIDEPELSLHLSWQRRFTRAVMNAAPDIQLVFATHSPEIVGSFGDKAVEVVWRNHHDA